MRKQSVLLGVLSFGLSVQAGAALPPFWQSAREIEALMKKRELSERLHSVAPIKEIRRTEEGYRLTTTDDCFVTARVKYIPTDVIGPSKFEIELLDSGCRK